MSDTTKPDYRTPPAGMQPFPAAEAVFAPDQLDLAQHLHPLFSLDISQVNPAWSGTLHMLSPLEPAECLVGDLTEGFDLHNELLKTNWIGFQLENGRYRLCGDPRYFFLHPDNAALPEPHRGARANLEKHYAEQHASFAATVEIYKSRGVLARPEWPDARPLEFVEELGGDVDALANWVETIEFPMEFVELDDEENTTLAYPLSPAGNRFYHVASVPGWHYRSAGADAIVMLYEPVEGLVLFSFDYS